MYIDIETVKGIFPNAVGMEEYAAGLEAEEARVILRDYDEPTSPPWAESGVEVFDFAAQPRPLADISAAYGSRPNVPGVNVVTAVKAALGPTGYCLHMSDGSYSGYSIWELKQFMQNFDSTDLMVYIAETFDCDDFAQGLQGAVNRFFPGIAFGTIWYGPTRPPPWGHAVNIFFSHTDNKVYLVEPQNDVFYAFNRAKWKAWMVIL